jgi:hypothetical protein
MPPGILNPEDVGILIAVFITILIGRIFEPAAVRFNLDTESAQASRRKQV